ncbi:hypothetical protein BC939DRAFT_527935 [Gamsiella multidivaricata]|uniref:uncharacterized protein n=1 Tax=Gamsiella multidivaricata TaxID=101098 RepID=UPI0022207EE0|nr:uncharacterized protein BC939DRAFT_527935 [Gamsiella multidivaricata]KAI7825648.1 hypothetical protein BC939DRAFT_527935 [Gamsiella multidivaricata]
MRPEALAPLAPIYRVRPTAYNRQVTLAIIRLNVLIKLLDRQEDELNDGAVVDIFGVYEVVVNHRKKHTPCISYIWGEALGILSKYFEDYFPNELLPMLSEPELPKELRDLRGYAELHHILSTYPASTDWSTILAAISKYLGDICLLDHFQNSKAEGTEQWVFNSHVIVFDRPQHKKMPSKKLILEDTEPVFPSIIRDWNMSIRYDQHQKLIALRMGRLIQLHKQRPGLGSAAKQVINDLHEFVSMNYAQDTPAADSAWLDALLCINKCFRTHFPHEPLPELL